MAKSILFSEMTPAEEWERRFHDWYNTEHIPIRMNAPGFERARRYREIGSDKCLAVYEMESADAMRTPEYQKIKEQPSEETRWMLSNVSGFTRYTGEQIGEQKRTGLDIDPYEAPVLYSVMFEVPKEREDEFNRWYEEDHVPTLLKNGQWLACRRYKLISGDPESWTHLALHYLADVDALQSEERAEARRSPWRARLAEEEWFKGKYMQFELLRTFTATRD